MGVSGLFSPLCCWFQKSYWCGSERPVGEASETSKAGDERHFERDPVGLEVGINICNLRKVRAPRPGARASRMRTGFTRGDGVAQWVQRRIRDPKIQKIIIIIIIIIFIWRPSWSSDHSRRTHAHVNFFTLTVTFEHRTNIVAD